MVDGVAYAGDWTGAFYAIPVDQESVAAVPDWTFHIDDTNAVAFGRIVSSAAVTEVDGTEVVIFGGGATIYVLAADTTNPDGEQLTALCLDPRDIGAARCGGTDDVQVEVESSPAVVHNADGSLQIVVGMDVGVTYHEADLLTEGSGTGFGCASVWGSPAVDVDAAGQRGLGRRLRRLPQPPGERARRLRQQGRQLLRLPPEHRPPRMGRPRRRVGPRDRRPRRRGGIIGTPSVGEVSGRPAVFTTTALSTPIYEPLDEGHPQSWADTSLGQDPGRLLSLSAIDAENGAILWRTPLSRQSYGAPTYSNGIVLVPSTFSAELLAFQADTGVLLSVMPVAGASSSSPTVVGDTIYLGAGTRTSDLEFKAFGASAAETFLGTSPLSPASGLFAYRIVAPEVAQVPAIPPSPVAPFGPPPVALPVPAPGG